MDQAAEALANAVDQMVLALMVEERAIYAQIDALPGDADRETWQRLRGALAANQRSKDRLCTAGQGMRLPRVSQ